MLLLSILFTSVCLLFVYSMMRDTGKNTPYARRQGKVATPIGTKQAKLHLHDDRAKAA